MKEINKAAEWSSSKTFASITMKFIERRLSMKMEVFQGVY